MQNGSHGNNMIGKYQIIKTLGEGSFGKVKLAYYQNNKVALKIISTNKLKADDMRGRIDREISFLRLLRHPHIIKLYDVIKSSAEIIMVMEFAQNELFDYIVQRDKMSEQEARRFFQQIISAVEYCHRLKIVHRDLKPENLLLDDQLNVKIADFGLSNIMTDGNFLKTSCGSPNYASPEVISGKLYAGPEVDVWSCGVILYVMLCRRLPFDDESIPVLFKNISNGVYTLPKFLSEGASSLIQKMLIVNPLNRITVEEIFEDEWFKVDLPEYLVPTSTTRTTSGTSGMSSTTSGTTTSTTSHGDFSEGRRLVSPGQDSKPIEVDDNLVGILASTLGYDPVEVYDALHNYTVNSSRYVEIRDAYLLIQDNQELIHELEVTTLEHQQHAEQHQQRHTHHSSHHLGGSARLDGSLNDGTTNTDAHSSATVPSSFNNDVHPDETSTISILPTSLPSIHRSNMVALGNSRAAMKIQPLNNSRARTPGVGAGVGGDALAQQGPPPAAKAKKTKWHFGIRSRSYPLDVMGEIYIALKNLGAEWSKPNEEELWTIRVRWKYGSASTASSASIAGEAGAGGKPTNTPSKVAAPEFMRMVIQLFQIEPNNYLVDFKFNGWENEQGQVVHSGSEEMSTFSAYPFLHLTTKLIMELAVNSG